MIPVLYESLMFTRHDKNHEDVSDRQIRDKRPLKNDGCFQIKRLEIPITLSVKVHRITKVIGVEYVENNHEKQMPQLWRWTVIWG